jgi:O-antigen/teichoic acid export membrane protein
LQFREAVFSFRRIASNALMQIGGQVLPLCAAAIAVPVIYRNIGASDFGVFTIALSAVGMFSLMDLGLGRSAVRFISRALAIGDSVGAASIAAQCVIMLGGVCLGLSALFVAAIPYISARLITTDTGSRASLEATLYILTSAIPFLGATSVFRAVLEAREKFLFIGVMQSIFGTLTYALPLFVSLATKDVRLITMSAIACRFAAVVPYFNAARRQWEGGFPWRLIDLRIGAEFRQFSAWSVVSNLVGTVIVYGDRALITRLVPLDQIAFYNVPLEVFGRLMIVINGAITVAFPLLSRHAEKRALLLKAYLIALALMSVLIGGLLLLCAALVPMGLDMWLGKEFRTHSTLLVRIVVLGLLFQGFNALALAFLNARGLSRLPAIMHLVEAPVYLIAVYLFGSRFGLVGIACVWSARALIEFVGYGALTTLKSDRESRRYAGVGAVFAFCGAVPIGVVAATGGNELAGSLWLVFAMVSMIWVLGVLRSNHDR